MPDTTVAPAGALSPHVPHLARLLLREIVLDRHARLPADTDATDGTVDDDPDAGRAMAMPAAGPDWPAPRFADRLRAAAGGRPAAADLTAAEIAAWIAAGDDPWAVGSSGGPAPLAPPPVAEMLAAVALARLCPDRAAIDALVAPGAVTLARLPGREARGALQEALTDPLALMGRVGGMEGAGIGRLHVVTLDADAPRGPGGTGAGGNADADARRLDRAVGEGLPALVLAADRGALTPSARAVVSRDVAWPEVDGAGVVEMLRATHSRTGYLAEVAIRAALPSDGALATLPPPLWTRAFAEATTLGAARSLAEAATGMAVRAVAGVTLDDLHGVPALRAELAGLVDDLAAWRSGKLDWAQVASSLLLYGPPGGGKTMAAAALAGSAGATFVATSYAECQRAGHLGDYLKAMAERVEEAITGVPSVFFLDELDSYAHRSGGFERIDRYMASVVNALLEQLSRLNAVPGVIVIGATNFPERIDPALIRAGRFDFHLEVPHPDRVGIDAILRGHLGDRLGALDPSPVVDRLIGASGAAVAAVARAGLGLARRAGRGLALADLHAAADRIAPPHAPGTLRAIAAHEAGHVVATAAVGLPLPRAVSITPAGGITHSDLPRRRTRADLDAMLVVFLAGRVGEAMLCGAPSSGAGLGPDSDLDHATATALAIESEFGLGGETLIHAPVARADRHRLPERLRARVEAHLRAADGRARAILRERRGLLEAVAAALVAERQLGAGRIAALVAEARVEGRDVPPLEEDRIDGAETSTGDTVTMPVDGGSA